MTSDEPPRQARHSLGLTARLGPIQISPDMLAELETESRRQGVTVSAAIRQAIRAWLDLQKQQS